MSADNEGIGKHHYLCSLISQQSARCIAGYVFSSCGFGESTTDVVFAGNGLIYENGSLLARSKRFCMEEQLIISEIDVERIRAERESIPLLLPAREIQEIKKQSPSQRSLLIAKSLL